MGLTDRRKLKVLGRAPSLTLQGWTVSSFSIASLILSVRDVAHYVATTCSSHPSRLSLCCTSYLRFSYLTITSKFLDFKTIKSNSKH